MGACSALGGHLHDLMGICTLWTPSAQFSERIDAVGEGIYPLGEAADTLWKSTYTLGWPADMLWERADRLWELIYTVGERAGTL